ncbi:MAG: CinA family nicotinamide mononucleotide deamidase-related protein, partial [Acidimicrobiales bacterium]
AGIESHLQLKVGDNLGRMEDALSVALVDADAVIVCGGLGPTHDDLTREAIASLMGAELVQDDSVAAVIRGVFARRNREMPANNLRQALVPTGATVIPQTRGTAPGLICPVGDRVVYAVPGVPHEMKDMFERAVLPDLLARSGERAVIASRVLRTWGDSESRLNERLDGIIGELDRLGNPTLAFLASGWEGIKVRLTVKAADAASATGMLDDWDGRVRAVVGDVVFGTDDDTMESVVLDLLRARGLTLGLAESVTGGLVGGRSTNVAGSSSVFRGGVVSYASDVKFDVLGVDPGPVVSEEAAIQMATGARRVLGCDVALALTGVAGPDEQDGRAVGTLCAAVTLPDGSTVAGTWMMPPARDQMRQMSVITALDFLRRTLISSVP